MMKRPAPRLIVLVTAFSLLAVGALGCGKYGPPERAEPVENTR